MSMWGSSNGTEQWCPVKRGGCILGVSTNRGFIIHTYVRMYVQYIRTVYVHMYMCSVQYVWMFVALRLNDLRCAFPLSCGLTCVHTLIFHPLQIINSCFSSRITRSVIFTSFLFDRLVSLPKGDSGLTSDVIRR